MAYLAPRLAAYRLFETRRIESYTTLTVAERRLLNSPWYHDFSSFGLNTVQEPNIWKANQPCKQNPLFLFIDRALALCREARIGSRGVALFCADGYYGLYAVKGNAESIHGLDLNEKDLAKAALAAKLLGYSQQTHFEKRYVFTIAQAYDFGICAGGLYHISDPAALLQKLSRHVRGPLVIQTVYSLANCSEEYFEAPAPGWHWGCRFSYEYLKRMIEETNWKILAEDKNELLGNRRLEDRGSAYLLCTPKAGG